MFSTVKIFAKTYFETKRAKKVFESDKYYKDLNVMPLYNYWKCMYGDMTYLWKKKSDYVPFFFKRIFNDMAYQLDFLDLVGFRKKVESALYMNRYLTTKDIKYKRKSDEKRLYAEMFDKKNKEDVKLNDAVKFVQVALKLSFQLDPHKISAGYFFSLYNDAVKIAENKNYGYN